MARLSMRPRNRRTMRTIPSSTWRLTFRISICTNGGDAGAAWDERTADGVSGLVARTKLNRIATLTTLVNGSKSGTGTDGRVYMGMELRRDQQEIKIKRKIDFS